MAEAENTRISRREADGCRQVHMARHDTFLLRTTPGWKAGRESSDYVSHESYTYVPSQKRITKLMVAMLLIRDHIFKPRPIISISLTKSPRSKAEY
jgi:hypothetical protein